MSGKTAAPARRMSRNQVIRDVQHLAGSGEFETLLWAWRQKRAEIEARGRKERKPENWAELDGFDSAVEVIQTWANTPLLPEHDDRRDEL